jgi:prepilin-type N-terminal cleavage/methylation domain-containing protein
MNPANRKGSTLIEVIVAMLILSLVIIGLNAGVVSLINSNIASKELNAATAVGYQLFEQFRRDDYDNVVAIGTSVDIVRDRYIRDWRMTTDATKTKIDLYVRWPVASQKHQISLSTIIARP